MNVSVKQVLLTGAEARGEKVAIRTRTLVAQAAIGDTEQYVPFEHGALRETARTESVPEEGKIVYGNNSVRYAAAQYYACPNKTYPGTCNEWFSASLAANLPKWLRIVEREEGVKAG